MAANTFNFDSYNGLIKTAGTGLRLHLGIQLIKDVVESLERFDNPLEAELRPIYNDLKEVHRMYKEAAKKIAEARTNDAEAKAAGGRADNQALMEMLAAMKTELDELRNRDLDMTKVA